MTLSGLFDEILEKMVFELENVKENENLSKSDTDNLKFEVQGFIDLYNLLVKRSTNEETKDISFNE